MDTPELEEVLNFIVNHHRYVEPYLLPEYNTDEEMAKSDSTSYPLA
ncbi:hypothetical protein [Neolewinella persica]|nr:hypothetical protein [Neolewinella persica]